MLLGPNIWGPHLWKALHMISIGYPSEPNEEQKQNYKYFFENVYKVIPCSVCSNNYKKHLIELPIVSETMKNRQNLAKWLINIHNIVNKEHGKIEIDPDEALLLIFNNFNDKNVHNNNTDNKSVHDTSNSSNILCILILIFFILVSIAIIYKKN
jgi:hypothetical protein